MRLFYEYWSDREVTRYMNIAPLENVRQAEEIIDFLNALAEQNMAFRWSILCKKSNQIVGTCGFNNWDRKNQRAEIGYELGRPFWGRGIMTEALMALLSHGFGVMGLNRIQALVEPANANSRKLLMGIGFEEEGLLRQYEQSKGTLVDLIMYSMLKSDSGNTSV